MITKTVRMMDLRMTEKIKSPISCTITINEEGEGFYCNTHGSKISDACGWGICGCSRVWVAVLGCSGL